MSSASNNHDLNTITSATHTYEVKFAACVVFMRLVVHEPSMESSEDLAPNQASAAHLSQKLTIYHRKEMNDLLRG
jgi:hypothetical protein